MIFPSMSYYIINEVSIHNQNIQTLLIEVYKNLNALSPAIMLDLFTTRENIDNLRNFPELYYEKREPFDMALRPSHTRQLSYGNYYRMIKSSPILIASATRKRRDIKMPLSLPPPCGKV